MEFVVAAANLRMSIYSIPCQTPFQIKVRHQRIGLFVPEVSFVILGAFSSQGIAGRIVHAIATSNAIVGLNFRVFFLSFFE